MADDITIRINNQTRQVPRGTLLAVALAAAGETRFRRSVTGQARGPLCGMGICFECRVTVNLEAHVRACQAICEEGMEVRTDE